jgi:hypothetical protein
LTRAREMANIISTGAIPVASYDIDGMVDLALTSALSNSNIDGGTVTAASGISDAAVYNITTDNNSYTYDGGTV